MNLYWRFIRETYKINLIYINKVCNFFGINEKLYEDILLTIILEQ